MDTTQAENILLEEQRKYDYSRGQLMSYLSDNFKDYIDESGNYNFNKMKEDGKEHDFREIESFIDVNDLYSNVIDDFINSNSIVKPVNIRSSIMPSTDELIERTEGKRNYILEKIGDNNKERSFEIGNNQYKCKMVPIKEEIAFYINCLKNEIALATNTKVGTDEYNEVLIRICTNIVSNNNKEFKPEEEETAVKEK